MHANTTLHVRDVRNISTMNMTFGDFNRGNCSYAIRANKTRLSQTADLNYYSRLIDAGEAIFTASALMGCDVPGNNAYLSISMRRSDGIVQGKRLFLSKSREIYLFSF